MLFHRSTTLPSGNERFSKSKMKPITDTGVSSFRTRRRLEFPMEHNRNDVYLLTQQQRARRLKTKEELRQIACESENLRQYSQRRFDYAVQNTLHRESTIQHSRRLLSCSFRPSTSTGPTRYGSVLYNKTPLLLNSVRVRPHSGVPSMYDHTTSTHPDIQKTLLQSNCAFQVRPNSYFSDHEEHLGSMGEDFVLVPLSNKSPSDGIADITDQDLDNVSTNSASNRPQTVDYFIPKVKLDVLPTPNATLFRRCTNVEGFPAPSEIPEKQKEAERTPTPCGSAISKNSHSDDKQEGLTIGSLKTMTGTARHGSVYSNISFSCSVKVDYRPKPRCWVDECTVSSVTSHNGTLEEVHHDCEDVTLPELNVDNKTATGVVFKDEVEEIKLMEPMADGEHVCAENASDLHVVNLEDVKEQTIELPTFVCPRSEKKSRQEAIKQWLAKTSFTSAKKTVPLL